MRTNKGFFSGPLFRENLKRFWPMAFAGFIVYFLSGPMLIITEGAKIGVWSAMHYVNPGYLLAALTLSVAAALTVFGYLQKVSSSSIMHSMPFSRRSLYVTSYVSGLFLAMLPAILTALLLIVMKKPVLVDSTSSGYFYGFKFVTNDVQTDIYTFAHIGRWFVNQFVLIWFSYSISVFAGIISGNGVIHMLTACGLNCLVPVLYVLYKIYRNIFLFGVTYDDFDMVTLLRMHPVFCIVEGSGFGMMSLRDYDQGGLSLAAQVIPFYIVIPVLVTLLGFILYRFRPLERASDSYVFRAASLIIGMLLVVVFGSIIGLIFKSAVGNVWGFAIGGLVSFVIAEMIVRKTMKIIDREGLIHFAACALALGLIVAGFTMDFFGIESMIPKVSAVESAELYANTTIDNLKLRSEENIERITAIHENILSHRDEIENGYELKPGEEVTLETFHVVYKLKNGKTVERMYRVPTDMICEGGYMQAIYDTGESLFDTDRLRKMDPSRITMDLWYGMQNDGGYYADRSIMDYQLSVEQKAALLSAIADDLDARRKDILGWSMKYGHKWNDGTVSGYVSISNPITAAEAAELDANDFPGGSNHYIENIPTDAPDNYMVYEKFDYDISISGDDLVDLVIRIGAEIPLDGTDDGYNAEPADVQLIDLTDLGAEDAKSI